MTYKTIRKAGFSAPEHTWQKGAMRSKPTRNKSPLPEGDTAGASEPCHSS